MSLPLLEFDFGWDVYANRLYREARKLSTDRLVKLFEIDATNIGGLVFRFISSVDPTMPLISITHVGNVATATTKNNHTLDTLDSVRISNADDPLYNGDYSVTVLDAKTFTYTMADTPVLDAGGAYLAATRLANTMKYDGNDYVPIEIQATGFEFDGQGAALPTPSLLVSNKHRILMSSVITLKGLKGAKFTRIRTFRKHLDDGDDPDNTLYFPKEIYKINRRVAQNKVFMQFELASPLDQAGVQIPGGQCLRDTCLNRYRIPDGIGGFDYSRATCPYAGTTYFKANGDATANPAEDRCGKHLQDCIDRFGTGAELPFRGTPGIGG